MSTFQNNNKNNNNKNKNKNNWTMKILVPNYNHYRPINYLPHYTCGCSWLLSYPFQSLPRGWPSHAHGQGGSLLSVRFLQEAQGPEEAVQSDSRRDFPVLLGAPRWIHHFLCGWTGEKCRWWVVWRLMDDPWWGWWNPLQRARYFGWIMILHSSIWAGILIDQLIRRSPITLPSPPSSCPTARPDSTSPLRFSQRASTTVTPCPPWCSARSGIVCTLGPEDPGCLGFPGYLQDIWGHPVIN